MKLFHWPIVEALKNYSSGDIIVMAEDVETARQAARAYADTHLKEHRSWWFDPDWKIHHDELEYYTKWIAILEKDLAREPDLIDHPIFIKGSE